MEYPLKGEASSADAVLLQTGALGGPYAYTTAYGLVVGALDWPGSQLGVGIPLPGNAIDTGVLSTNFLSPLGCTFGWNLYRTGTGSALLAAGNAAEFCYDGFAFSWAAGSNPNSLPSLMALNNDGAAALFYDTWTVARNPIAPLEVATKQYVDNAVNRPPSFVGSVTTVSVVPPGVPEVGDGWFDPVDNTLSIWNGTSWQYIGPIPGGPSGAVQYNNNGAFDGSSNIMMDPSGQLIIGPTTVSALPSPSSAYEGARATVDDAENLTGPLIGGGTYTIPVFCDGTEWLSDFGSAGGVNYALQYNNNGQIAGSPLINLRNSSAGSLLFGTTPGGPWPYWVDGYGAIAGQAPSGLRLLAPIVQFSGGSAVFGGVSLLGVQWSSQLTNAISHRIYANQDDPIIRFAGPVSTGLDPVSLGLRWFSVATLPPLTPSTPAQFQIAFVNDALNPTGPVQGGGAFAIPVYTTGVGGWFSMASAPTTRRVFWNTPGTYTYVPPPGVRLLVVDLRGAGGAGGGCYAGAGLIDSASGGGQGGFYSFNYTQPGLIGSIQVIVGAGGTGGPPSTAGGATSVNADGNGPTTAFGGAPGILAPVFNPPAPGGAGGGSGTASTPPLQQVNRTGGSAGWPGMIVEYDGNTFVYPGRGGGEGVTNDPGICLPGQSLGVGYTAIIYSRSGWGAGGSGSATNNDTANQGSWIPGASGGDGFAIITEYY